MNESSSPVLQSFNHPGRTSLGLLQYANVFLDRKAISNHFSWSAGWAPAHTTQGSVRLLSCQDTLLAYVHLAWQPRCTGSFVFLWIWVQCFHFPVTGDLPPWCFKDLDSGLTKTLGSSLSTLGLQAIASHIFLWAKFSQVILAWSLSTDSSSPWMPSLSSEARETSVVKMEAKQELLQSTVTTSQTPFSNGTKFSLSRLLLLLLQ